MRVLYFDVETTGLPKASLPLAHPDQPHVTQLGFIFEVNGHDALIVDSLVKPDNWPIHKDSGTGIGKIASDLTGITQDMCERDGLPIADVIELFVVAAENADLLVCHNTAFDTKLISMEYARLRPDVSPKVVLCNKPIVCTMKAATPVCRLPKGDGKGSGYKWPKLIEAMQFFFNEGLDGAHSAIVDILATRRVFHKLGELGYLDEPLTAVGVDPSTVEWRQEPTKNEKVAAIASLIDDFAVNNDNFDPANSLPIPEKTDALAERILAGKFFEPEMEPAA